MMLRNVVLTAVTCAALSTSTGCALPAGVLPARPQTVHTTDCAGAREAAIETLRELGYAIVGVYDPMPGRLAIIAAEKQTPERRFQSNVTLRCDERQVEVTATQPTLAFHDPHFEEDFRQAWEERTGGRVARPLRSSGPIEVTRGREPTTAPSPRPAPNRAAAAPRSPAPELRSADTAAPAPAKAPEVMEPARPPGDSRAPARPTAETAAAETRTTSGGEGARADAGAATTAASPSVRFDLLSAAEARARFGADLGAAGLTVARVGIVNRTSHAYLLSVPLVILMRQAGDATAPLTWADASGRIAQSSAGQGWKSYDELSRELITDQVLAPGDTVSGVVLYPAGEYARVQIVLVDRDSARSERFEAAIPPAPPS